MPNPAVFGQVVTFTATVSANLPGAGVPSGAVTFMDGSTSLGSATLVSGTAVLPTSALAVGSHSITAVYSGDGNFLTSNDSLSEVVNQDATTTAIIADAPNPSVFGGR